MKSQNSRFPPKTPFIKTVTGSGLFWLNRSKSPKNLKMKIVKIQAPKSHSMVQRLFKKWKHRSSTHHQTYDDWKVSKFSFPKQMRKQIKPAINKGFKAKPITQKPQNTINSNSQQRIHTYIHTPTHTHTHIYISTEDQKAKKKTKT